MTMTVRFSTLGLALSTAAALAAGALVIPAHAGNDYPQADAIAVEETTDAAAPTAEAVEAQTIVEIAAGTEGFSTLVAAVQAADLVDVLSGDGPFTVFAPTDEAFAALPEGTLEALLLPENKAALQKVLKYHVVEGSVGSGDLASGPVSTVAQLPVDVVVGEDAITVGGAQVIAADIAASNGVIHVIDTVIVPPLAE